jgi:HK97 family phage prohead protease
MEHKVFALQKSEWADKRVSAIFATTGNEDSVGDIILPGAFKKTLKERARRIRVLWNHRYEDPPIATVEKIQEIDLSDQGILGVQTGLWAEVNFLDTPRAQEVYEAIKAGAISEASIGFDLVKNKWKIEGNKRIISELILWDISFVNWGANDKTYIVEKAAVPFRSYGVDLESSWNAPTLGDFTSDTWDDLSDAEKRRIGNHFAWSQNWPPEAFGDLKLPHHVPSADGVGKAVWRGVSAAMAALMGARGGVDIPDSDRQGVYNHLVQHYKEMDKIPPDYKSVDEAYHLAKAMQLVSGSAKRALWKEWLLRYDPKLYRKLMEVGHGDITTSA